MIITRVCFCILPNFPQSIVFKNTLKRAQNKKKLVDNCLLCAKVLFITVSLVMLAFIKLFHSSSGASRWSVG